MSDIYIDDCGDIFRGYWTEEVLKSTDDAVVGAGGPGTSLGRLVVPDKVQEFKDIVLAHAGDTYMLGKRY